MNKLRTTVTLTFFLFTLGAPPCVAQESRKGAPLFSPRLAALQRELEAGDHAALDRLWEEITRQGTPLIEPICGDDKHVLVTFLWRGREEVKNVVVFSVLGVLWNYNRKQLAENQMTHIPGTDVWYKTYRVHKDARFTYYLSPNDPLLPSSERKEDKDWATWQPDPLNPRRYTRPHPDRDWISSLVEMPEAPPQPWVRPKPSGPTGELNVHHFRSSVLGNERRIWVYTPPGYKSQGEPYGLLVLFDGWAFSQMIPTGTILDNLLAQGSISPLVAVMIGHPTQKDRSLELGCYSPFNEFLAQELIPWVRQRYHVTSDPTKMIVGGGSRGGLAAAFAALQHPEIFGNVFSQGGYFSWDPREDQEGQDDIEYEWLIRQYATGPKLPLRFYLSVGVLEQRREFPDSPTLLQSNRHMRDVLEAKGYPLRYTEFSGGHEDINLPNALAEGLSFLVGTQTKTQEGEKK